MTQTMIPLAEVLRRVEAAPQMRKSIGRSALIECCLKCQTAQCDPKASRCLARQQLDAKLRAYYAANRDAQRERCKRYYAANRERIRAHRKAENSTPEALEVSAVKRRARYERRAAAEGRTVQPYRWTSPTKNKGPATAGPRT